MNWGLGTKVKTLVAWSGVPVGTVGYVCEDYGSGYMIGWDLPNKPYPHDLTHEEVGKLWAVNNKCPLRDGFDKKDELQHLKVLAV